MFFFVMYPLQFELTPVDVLERVAYNEEFLPFKSGFFWRPSERWHMMEKMPTLIFRPEISYSESINVV